MNRIPVLIADDEPLARESLAILAAQDSELEVVGACGDGETALEMIRSHRPAIVFLDIQMPRRTGIEVMAELDAGFADPPAVVLVTAYDQHAVRAFELNAIDYILKPFRDDRFRASVARAKAQVARAAAPNAPPEPPRRIVFRVDRGHLFLESEQIAWIEAQGESAHVRCENQTHAVRESFQSVEKRLDPSVFVRIHRSFLVNHANIRRLSPTPYGDYEVQMSDGTKIPLSRTYREKVRQLISFTE